MPLEIWMILTLGLAVFFGVMEIFITSFGFLALLSVACLIASTCTAFAINELFGFIYLIVLMIVSPIIVMWFLRFLPTTAIGKRFGLETNEEDKTTIDPIRAELLNLIGREGKVVSRMMPSGIVEINGKTYNAVCEGGAVDPGGTIVAIRSETATLIVRAVPQTRKPEAV